MFPHRSEPLQEPSDTRKMAFIFYDHKLSMGSLYDPTGHAHFNDCSEFLSLGFCMDSFKGRMMQQSVIPRMNMTCAAVTPPRDHDQPSLTAWDHDQQFL